jgi:gamma-glutamyl phosphate reductase
MTDREIMQQALEALTAYDGTNNASQRKRVLAALRERLAQPEQEPVKFNCTVVDDAHPEGVPLSQWGRQSLTEATIRNMCEHVPDYDISTHDLIQFARAIERAHGIKEKNT